MGMRHVIALQLQITGRIGFRGDVMGSFLGE
jgi:hypothetical protein